MNVAQLSFLSYLEHETSARPADFLPVYEPLLGEVEEEMVMDAMRSGWISSLGKYVQRFEEEFAAFCGCEFGISASNGTTALHLALHALGVGSGDQVIVPALTFVATANAVAYTGATPIFVDVDEQTWTLEPSAFERAISPHTKAVIPVHLYGHPVAMDDVRTIAERHGILVVEDAAEAHGAKAGDRRVGSLGDVAAFSFFANKIVTTGEGGMLTTNDAELAARCRMLRDHAMPPSNRYWHDEIGFNYRLTSLQAAVGVAQMTRIHDILARKRAIAHLYNTLLADIEGITLPVERDGYRNVYWMYSVLIDAPYPIRRDDLIRELRTRGIDSRPFFHPLDTLPMYRMDVVQPVAHRLGQRGLNLPSSPLLTDDQVHYICSCLRQLATHGEGRNGGVV